MIEPPEQSKPLIGRLPKALTSQLQSDFVTRCVTDRLRVPR